MAPAKVKVTKLTAVLRLHFVQFEKSVSAGIVHLGHVHEPERDQDVDDKMRIHDEQNERLQIGFSAEALFAA